MSYCRFSCNDFQSDIYCYEHVGGFFAIHVACNRPVWGDKLPPEEDYTQENIEAWVKRHNRVMEMLDDIPREDIGLPHDGERFCEPTAQAALERLLELRDIGYNVPQHAIDGLKEDAA